LAKVLPNPDGNGFAFGEDLDSQIAKSDSVNIFTIKDDPFDDEFFT